MKTVYNSELVINKKTAVGYGTTAVIGILYMIYYDTRFGASFMIILLLAPLISYLLIKSSLSNISIELELSNDTAYKGEITALTVTINKESFLPIPFFYFEFFSEDNFSKPEHQEFLISVSSDCASVITQKYRTEIWGNAMLGIRNVAAFDYLGLFKFKIMPENPQAVFLKSVAICPALYESQTNELLAAIYNEMLCEEKEDERQNNIISPFSEPGYEHRPYVPGDALKRINWKLSARIDKYMVRKYEPLLSSKPVIMLDCGGLQTRMLPADKRKQAMLMEERIIEAVLAMLSSVCKLSLTCTVYCLLGNEWREFEIAGKNDIYELQYTFSKYKFKTLAEVRSSSRIPTDLEECASLSAMVFTCRFDTALDSDIADMKAKGAGVNVVCSDPTGPACENMWIVNEAYDFYEV